MNIPVQNISLYSKNIHYLWAKRPQRKTQGLGSNDKYPSGTSGGGGRDERATLK